MEDLMNHPMIRSKAQSVGVYCVGRNWDWNNPHVLLTNMVIWTEVMGQRGYKINFRRWQDGLDAADDAIFIGPGFNLPGGKYVQATKDILTDATAKDKKVILYACDVELLKMWSPYLARLEIPHGLVSNFRKPWQIWQAQALFFDRQLWYDEKRIIKRPTVQPHYPVAYVGWPKKDRISVLKKIGYESLVILGFGANKQDEFDFSMADGNTAWPFIGELFEAAAWHVCISDKDHQAIWSSVSRPMEAWAANRPCAFHTSFVESCRKYVKWDLLKDFVFDNQVELHNLSKRRQNADGKYDLEGLAEDAALQKQVMTGTYYEVERPKFQWSDRFLRGEFLTDAPIQFLGDTSPGTVSDYNVAHYDPHSGTRSGSILDSNARPDSAR